MYKKLLKLDFWSLVTIAAVLIFALFLIYPLFALFLSSFLDPATGSFTMENFFKVFQKEILLSIID